jgi:hypothetical protein
MHSVQLDPNKLADIRQLESHDVFGVRVQINPETRSCDFVLSTRALVLRSLQAHQTLGFNLGVDWTYGIFKNNRQIAGYAGQSDAAHAFHPMFYMVSQSAGLDTELNSMFLEVRHRPEYSEANVPVVGLC